MSGLVDRLPTWPQERNSHMSESFSHPRCYAKSLGDCSQDISREHYISQSVLGAMELNAAGIVLAETAISGLHWQTGDSTHSARRAGLSKILCSRHNNELSSVDAAAGKFFGCLHRFEVELCDNEAADEEVVFDGRSIERWLLKCAVGIAAANVTMPSVGVGRQNLEIPKLFVEALFERRPWPADLVFYTSAGLSIPGATSRNNHAHSFVMLSKKGVLHGIVDHCNGIPLVICTVSHESWLARPSGIEFRRGKMRKRIRLSWEMPSTQDWLVLAARVT